MTFPAHVCGSLEGKLENTDLVENSLTIVFSHNTMQSLLTVFHFIPQETAA